MFSPASHHGIPFSSEDAGRLKTGLSTQGKLTSLKVIGRLLRNSHRRSIVTPTVDNLRGKLYLGLTVDSSFLEKAVLTDWIKLKQIPDDYTDI